MFTSHTPDMLALAHGRGRSLRASADAERLLAAADRPCPLVALLRWAARPHRPTLAHSPAGQL